VFGRLQFFGRQWPPVHDWTSATRIPEQELTLFTQVPGR
jgi:hypothetical protein